MSATIAVLDLLDRDGSVRHSVAVREWPLRVGRALDNDLVLDDAHTAPHHFHVAPDAEGHLAVTVGDSLNGLQVGKQRLGSGQQALVGVQAGDVPLELMAGRTHLRLRLAEHALAPELPMLASRSLTANLSTLAMLVLAAVLSFAFTTWLENDPDLFMKSLGSGGIYALAASLGWVAVWTLLSKVFTRQAHAGWHLGVLMTALLSWQALAVLAALLAFSLSLPWLTDFAFVPAAGVMGAMLYFHLQAVEPHHPKRTQAFAVAATVAALSVNVWVNYQTTDRLGSELYMNHLFPPALRVARPVDSEGFMQGVEALRPRLEQKAKEKLDE